MCAVATPARKHERIDVRVPTTSTARLERELGAFARYCVQRIERDLGEHQRWLVSIELGRLGYSAIVEIEHLGLIVETRGYGNDGALAIWDAMCRIEQELRHQVVIPQKITISNN